MTTIVEYSKNAHVLWNSEIDFPKRGDALYWNPLALKTLDKLIEKTNLRVSDIARVRDKKIIPELTELYSLVELDDIDNKSGLVKPRRVYGREINSAKVIFKKGDVLFGRLRFYLKNIGIAPSDGVGSTEIYPLEIKDKSVSPEVLSCYLRSIVVNNILKHRSQGSNHPRISKSDLEDLPFPKLNQETISITQSASKQGQDFFTESLLKFGEVKRRFESYLGSWNKLDKKAYNLWKGNIDSNNRLDAGFWIGENEFFSNSVRLRAVVDTVFTGKTPDWNSYSDYEGVRILKVRHLSNTGLTWNLRNRDYVNQSFYEANSAAEIREGDILIASAAHQKEYIGKDVSIIDEIPNSVGKAIASAKINVIRPNETINPYVLLELMQSKVFYNEVQRVVRGESAELYGQDILDLPVPKMLLKEDFPLSDEVESQLKDSFAKRRLAQEYMEHATNYINSALEWARVN